MILVIRANRMKKNEEDEGITPYLVTKKFNK